MYQIPENVYADNFKNFLFTSLYIKEEVIASLERIRDQCIITTEKEIYNTNIVKTMRLEEFRQIESGAISQIALYLNAWKDNIQNIIQTSFADSQKGWINLYETSKEVYELGKLKKYLTMIKVMMQDSLYTLTVKSCYKFVETIENYIPYDVVITNPLKVQNTYKLTKEQQEVDPEYARNNPPIPLLSIEIIKGGDMFVYSVDPNSVVEITKIIFEEGLSKIRTIHSIEEVVMEHLFKRQEGKSSLKVPVIPDSKPVPPSQ